MGWQRLFRSPFDDSKGLEGPVRGPISVLPRLGYGTLLCGPAVRLSFEKRVWILLRRLVPHSVEGEDNSGGEI